MSSTMLFKNCTTTLIYIYIYHFNHVARKLLLIDSNKVITKHSIITNKLLLLLWLTKDVYHNSQESLNSGCHPVAIPTRLPDSNTCHARLRNPRTADRAQHAQLAATAMQQLASIARAQRRNNSQKLEAYCHWCQKHLKYTCHFASSQGRDGWGGPSRECCVFFLQRLPAALRDAKKWEERIENRELGNVLR